MFFKLVARNSKRNRKENGLFFASMLVSIVAFYIVLSLPRQDVMIFLADMESNAVDRLMRMIPLFFGMTLFILFFLVYYGGKFQLERRRHEFGVCLMLGMRRWKLFAVLMAEDFRSSVLALMIGVPIAVFLAEVISLITARLVGIGIIGHRFSFSPEAVFWTAVGFIWVKFAAFLLLSGRIAGQEIGDLLVEMPGGTKRRKSSLLYVAALLIGLRCLAAAYGMAISGFSWYETRNMGLTLLLGGAGTMLLFYGLRAVIDFLVKYGKKDRQLHVFNFRQLQENVILRSNTLAISSMLILAALCCFGAGVAIAGFYGSEEQHVLDYTFAGHVQNIAAAREILAGEGLEGQFSELFEIKLGHIRTAEDRDTAFCMESVLSALEKLPESESRDVLLHNLGEAHWPYLISLSGYNRLLAVAGEPELVLGKGEAAVYMDQEAVTWQQKEMLDFIIGEKPEVWVDTALYHLTGTVQTVNLVTDRSIRLSFALILPDNEFDCFAKGECSVYLNGVLNMESGKNVSLMEAISEMNGKLDRAGLKYESYLQNMGRQLFYMVAASYITIYLAIIFLIIANTVIGVQFLMGQIKSGGRYKALIHLGATYEVLCRSARKQINWYFGIPVSVAVVSSFFGVRALLSGLLSTMAQGSIGEMMWISGAMILVLVVVEFIYMAAVKRSSSRYLLTLMVPERRE